MVCASGLETRGLRRIGPYDRDRQAHYPVQADILNSATLANVHSNYGTYFLPQAFPEGSPQHPSYPQGHATMAGACATILKAAFDGSVQFNTLNNGTIVTANEDGSGLLPYRDTDTNDITVNGEINKLASNIGQARDFAGIHWRSDYEWDCGSARLRPSAFFATRAKTASGRILRALPAPGSTERRSRSEVCPGARCTAAAENFLTHYTPLRC